MPHTTASSEPCRPRGGSAGVVLAALTVALAAMVAVHVLQPALDPLHEPVSFYVHFQHGWLLAVALGAFGFGALALAWTRHACTSRTWQRCLALFGLGMLVTALVPSDPYFPWQNDPTPSGLVHAAAALIAPLLLVPPMFQARGGNRLRWRKTYRALLALYVAALVGCAVSLATGFFGDTAPPWIGLIERVLALAAVAWVGLVAAEARRTE